MNLWNEIKKGITKIFWPWFKENVWPSIKKHVIELIAHLLITLKNKIKEFISSKFKKRVETAQRKAEEADQKANSTNNSSEAEKYEAIAQVWREVAEMYRKDNEDLKQEVEELVKETRNEADSEIANLDLSADFTKQNTLLRIGDKSLLLPPPGE